MTSAEKSKFRTTKTWKDFTKKLKSERDSKCECCGCKSKRLAVHHIFPENYTDLNPNRFALLCSRCHKNVSFLERIKPENWIKYNKDWVNLYKRFIGK